MRLCEGVSAFSRACWSSYLLRSLGHQPPFRGCHLLHRDREADGERGESLAVHPWSTSGEERRRPSAAGKFNYKQALDKMTVESFVRDGDTVYLC